MPDRTRPSPPQQFFYTTAVLAQCRRCKAVIVITTASDPRALPKLFSLCAVHDCSKPTPLVLIRPPVLN